MNYESIPKEDLIREVQELKKKLQNIQTEEFQYKAAIEYTGTAMLILEEDMTISEANSKIESITGYTKDEISLKRPFTYYIANEDKERLVDYFKRRRAGDNSVPNEYEFKLVHKNGSIRNVYINVNMIPKTKKSILSLIDITDRVKAETRLKESENRFKETAEMLPGIICEWNINLKLTYTNLKGLETFLLTNEDVNRGIYLLDMISKDDLERAHKDISNVLHGDYAVPQIYTVKRKDGKILHLLVKAYPIIKNGIACGMRMCLLDVSERVIAEQKLRESEKRFKSIYSWSPIGIALCNKEGKLIEMNRAFTKLFKIPLDANPLDVNFLLFDLLSLSKEKLNTLNSGNSIEVEIKMLFSPDLGYFGDEKYFTWYITPLEKSNSNNDVIYLVQVYDITERKNEEEIKIKKAQKETQEAQAVIANLRKEIIQKYSFQNMVSRSPLMKKIFDILPEVATAPATILITGESGTGKELIARCLHELSMRKEKPFIAVNCSALPENLLESELFGYKAGAFTDAKKDKPGIFLRASGGTIFLDEIGDISPAMQAKLLRVLQEKSFEPLGGTETITVDVRIVAATNKNLLEMVKKGSFREDLFYRINVLTINLPSLKERRCDIPILCDYFIEKFNIRYNKNIKGITKEALDAILTYDFPGNIRELENCIEHAFIFCKEDYINLSHLPLQFNSSKSDIPIELSFSNIKSLEELEKLYLKSVLEECGGSKAKAAEKLNLHQATLFRKCKKFNI
jgi:PAS domain S-box-containing protein